MDAPERVEARQASVTVAPGVVSSWVPSIALGVNCRRKPLAMLEKSRATCYNDQVLGPDEFRRALGHFATGVTIVTTWDDEARPTGLTASAMSSVSLDPPLVLVCVSHKSQSYPSFQPGAAGSRSMCSPRTRSPWPDASPPRASPVSRSSRASRTIEARSACPSSTSPGRVRMHHRPRLPWRRSHDLRRPGRGPRRARRRRPRAAALLPRPIRPPPVARGMPIEVHLLVGALGSRPTYRRTPRLLPWAPPRSWTSIAIPRRSRHPAGLTP